MKRNWYLLVFAWLTATAATASAFFIGEVMGITPCVLCWYQRIFMFPLVIVLGMACYSDDRRGAIYGLPLAFAGVLLAGYHTLLIAGFVSKTWIPCGSGVSCTEQKLEILNGLQIPWLSLTAFFIVTSLLFVYLKRTSK
ncbi:MAG: disulfide bond formation protein B [Rhodoferax sp.]|jgi:disulfide bond formation protein DsbB|uniref:disulfide bond formation protein B n=1 Tax=Rhodoferax sp. TaxID=50421 RepID=UPI001B3E5D27|nr:disulfide bond formation protein B [Rhodoferax sp.]MBP9060839.1 disulfide bond formation protein B [Rhodoferax sp.]MDP1530942.1 disulfide bond formation protein B [Rhodoferax sp.]MDP1942591.1 disulfide bond formation protein B [Rhodoferax sp.]MDP3193218.1 disulfide bond formation protein B [Rhodoferax sp.]MDP3865268.1 disulfide bond formation protein B [Rhodoferax sp.]